jgi:hypothetical protein
VRRDVALGQFSATGKPFTVDLDLILSSNLLVQANSGGGKSWLLRRMIEQTFGRVPQVVIDPEGEFSTLRGKFDVILVGREGDTPADVRSAQLLAHRLLELGVSAVVDLFEMSPPTRPLWVATFLQAFVDAPKRLWREVLFYADEAHTLAPEPGHGAVDSPAHRQCRVALIEMGSRGRKRGYGLVAATQRLGKLSKDLAAELKNVLIGQTFIDIDRERAAGSLGIAKADKRDFDHEVRNLPPGQFFAMGRALVLEPTLVLVGDVQTEHPEAGRRQSSPPPPTDKIRHLLPQFADLPREAEQEVATERELRAEAARLRVELEGFVQSHKEWKEHYIDPEVARLRAELAARPAVEVEVPVVPTKLVAAVRGIVQEAACSIAARVELLRSQETADARLKKSLSELEEIVGESREARESVTRTAGGPRVSLPASSGVGSPTSSGREIVPATYVSTELLSKCSRALLRVLAQRRSATYPQLAVLSGYSWRSSGFTNSVSRLRVAGFVEGGPRELRITPLGSSVAGDVEVLPTGWALLEYWGQKLGRCSATLLRAVYTRGRVTRSRLAELSGYSLKSSGFTNGLSTLRTLGLVSSPPGGDVEISGVFGEGGSGDRG